MIPTLPQHSFPMPTGPETLLLVVEFLTPLGDADRLSLFGACSRAFDRGTCVEQTVENASSPFLATVESTSNEHVLIEVTMRGKGQQLYSSREISFQPEDALTERARSLGLSLGVLANQLVIEEETPSPPAAPTLAEPVPPLAKSTTTKEPAPPPVRAARRKTKKPTRKSSGGSYFIGLSVGADLNPTWQGTAPSVDTSLSWLPLSSFVLVGRLSYAYQPSGDERATLSFFSPSAGAGWVFSLHGMHIFTLAEGGVEQVTASIADTGATGAIPSLTHFSGFARISTSLLYPIGADFHVSLTPAILASFSPTQPTVDGVDHGSTGLLRYVARAGITWEH